MSACVCLCLYSVADSQHQDSTEMHVRTLGGGRVTGSRCRRNTTGVTDAAVMRITGRRLST